MKLLNSNKYLPIRLSESEYVICRPNCKVVGRCFKVYWDLPDGTSDRIRLRWVDLESHTGVGCAVTLDNFIVFVCDSGRYLTFHNCRAYECKDIQRNN